MEMQHSDYPVQFDVPYPQNPHNRLTTFFRLILVIPIYFLFLLISGFVFHEHVHNIAISTAGGTLFLGPLLMILFRKKYPRWWFDWNLEFIRFSYRITVYLGLLRDEYPATDDHQAVLLNIEYPTRDKLNRGLPLIKWFLAIPHYIVLIILWIIVLILTIIAWFAILFTAKYPRSFFDFVVGVMRWSVRVVAYAFLLTTDIYPPFRLSP